MLRCSESQAKRDLRLFGVEPRRGGAALKVHRPFIVDIS
jgi:hypothetical protein